MQAGRQLSRIYSYSTSTRAFTGVGDAIHWGSHSRTYETRAPHACTNGRGIGERSKGREGLDGIRCAPRRLVASLMRGVVIAVQSTARMRRCRTVRRAAVPESTAHARWMVAGRNLSAPHEAGYRASLG